MSNNWRLRCLDCKEDSETSVNHGGHIFQGAIKAYPYIKKALEADASGYLEVSLMGYGSEVFSFLHEHDEHDVRVADEYGYVEENTEHSSRPPCPDYAPNQLIPCEKWRKALERTYRNKAASFKEHINKGTR